MYKLMIVEDEPIERKAIRMILKRKFFNLDILEDAKDGIEAVQNAKLYKPDIILMDIRMPESTGIEAQNRIIKFLPNVKTIILTAYSEFDYAQKSIKAGVVDYLLKPVKPYELENSIVKAIEEMEMTKLSKPNTIKFHEETSENALDIAIAYIEKNYTKKIYLNTVAKIVHFHPQYFSKYFKKETGMTFTEYITKLRLKKAKQLLAGTNKNIGQIASEVGYNDPAYFSKTFQKFENKSPYSFKKNSI